MKILVFLSLHVRLVLSLSRCTPQSLSLSLGDYNAVSQSSVVHSNLSLRECVFECTVEGTHIEQALYDTELRECACLTHTISSETSNVFKTVQAVIFNRAAGNRF